MSRSLILILVAYFTFNHWLIWKYDEENDKLHKLTDNLLIHCIGATKK